MTWEPVYEILKNVHEILSLRVMKIVCEIMKIVCDIQPNGSPAPGLFPSLVYTPVQILGNFKKGITLHMLIATHGWQVQLCGIYCDYLIFS